MMATTHALVGVAIAALASIVAPDLSLVAVLSAAAGGFFPDLDLYAGHRKTLHFPVYYAAAALAALAMAAVSPVTPVVAGALFLTAAAVHSLMDVAGGGLELRPWEGTSERAVFSHYHGTWIAPRRWIRYDGAPEDLALATVAAVPVVLAFDGPVQLGVLALLAVSAVYVLVRKPMVLIAEWLVDRVPAPVRLHVPDRFVEDLS
ncbi:MAG: metal-dependent hydrolase [Halanaeroarchaeum sp.]